MRASAWPAAPVAVSGCTPVEPERATEPATAGASLMSGILLTAFDVREGDALSLPPEERVKIW